jgi:hypothetical protein
VNVRQDFRNPVPAMRRYGRVVRWELAWAWRERRARLIAVNLLDGARTLLQGGVVAVLAGGLGGAGSAGELHPLAIAAAVALLAGGSAASFAHRVTANRLAIQFEKAVAAMVLDRTAGMPPQQRPSERQVKALVTAGARLAGRSLRTAVGAIQEIVRVLAFLAVCLALDPVLTAAVSVLTLPTLALHIVLNRRIHRNQTERLAERGDVKARMRRGGMEIATGSLVESEEYRLRLDRYERHINATAFADAISGVAIVIGVTFGIFWIVTQHTGDGVALGTSIAIAAAILFYLQSLAALLSSGASFTRLFGRVERTCLFITRGADPGPASSLSEGDDEAGDGE